MKKLLFPKVDKKFDRFPKGYVNDTKGWAHSRKDILGKKGSLLSLDIDMPGKGVCRLRCGHCFRRSPEFSKIKNMDMDEMHGQLEDAVELGLRSVKIIGPGEPLEDPHLFEFLELLKKMNITPLIFTKGHPIGDDKLAMKRFGIDGRELVARLDECGVSILLGTTSFHPETEDSIVGRKGYHATRNETILRLVEAGFNDFIPGVATRLAFIGTPATPLNIDEMFEIYTWAKSRNIQPVLAPTMIAGKAHGCMDELMVDEKELLDLYVKINLWALEKGMMTFEELEEQGIAPYAGAAPCNQIAGGAFLRGDGKLLRCPGDDYTILGDVREQKLEEIWKNSENVKKYSGMYNNYCPPKEGKSIPSGFFDKVLEEVRRRI